MLGRKKLKLSKYLPYSASIWMSVMAGLAGSQAQAQTADDVLNRMSEEQSFSYISGVVEGLAAARWAAEKPDSSGMTCIYDWYFDQNADVHLTITEWLARNSDQRAGFLIYVLTQRECPNK